MFLINVISFYCTNSFAYNCSEHSAWKEKDTESTVNSTPGQSARDASVLHCSRPDPHRHHGCSKAEDHVHHVCEDNVVDVNVRRFKHDDCRRTTARHGETRQERSKSIELEMKKRKNESIQATPTPQHSPSKGHSHGAEAFANVDGIFLISFLCYIGMKFRYKLSLRFC